MAESKMPSVIETIKKEINAGKFGAPGDRFITTRRLTEDYGVSLVTAQRIMVALRREGLIRLDGKAQFLSYGRVSTRSELGKRHKKSYTIGMHVVNIDNPYFSALVRAVEEEARRYGYSVIIKSSNYDRRVESEALRHFETLGVDGIISCPFGGPEGAEGYSKVKLPLVFMSSAVDGVDADKVLIDNYTGGKLVARHMIDNGYKHFVYVDSGKLRNSSDMRLKGYRDTLEKNGYRLENEDIISSNCSGATFESYIGRLLEKKKRPLGIFCYHDILAIGVFRICQQCGASIPSEVGLVGYDNLSSYQNLFPTLSSVDYRTNKLVSSAVRLLIKRIDGYEGETEELFIEPILTAKGSSGGGTL